MALGHAALAALLEGEASGYELAKRFDVSVANFWSATPQQLYRELERLEAEGLVAGRRVEQRRRPNKRVFRLTAAGRDELAEFVARPARPMAMRDDLLVKVQALDVGDVAAVRAAVAERIEHARAKLALYERIREAMLGGRSQAEFLSEAERVGPYLTLMGGRMYESQNIAWCEAVIDALERRGLSAEAAPRERAATA